MLTEGTKVSDAEVDLLIHFHKVEFHRWTDDEPYLRERARAGLQYWQNVKAGYYPDLKRW